MSGWILLAVAVLFFGGLLWGFMVGRSTNTAHQQAKRLEGELNEVRGEYDQYKEQVTQHFATTAELVNNLTASYRAVYQHLASSSQSLCGDNAPKLSMEGGDRLLAERSQDERDVTPETAAETAAEAAAEASTEAPVEVQAEASTEVKAEAPAEVKAEAEPVARVETKPTSGNGAGQDAPAAETEVPPPLRANEPESRAVH